MIRRLPVTKVPPFMVNLGELFGGGKPFLGGRRVINHLLDLQGELPLMGANLSSAQDGHRLPNPYGPHSPIPPARASPAARNAPSRRVKRRCSIICTAFGVGFQQFSKATRQAKPPKIAKCGGTLTCLCWTNACVLFCFKVPPLGWL